MRRRFMFGLALGALLLTGCGSTAAPTVEAPQSSTPTTAPPAAAAPASAVASAPTAPAPPTAVASAPSAAGQTSGPTAPPGAGKVIAIAAGAEFTCALLSGGGVKCWGRSDDGQLGNGSKTYWDGGTTYYGTPKYVVGLTSGVTTIAVGNDYTCALTSAGGVKCWPLDTHGTVGDVAGLTSGVTAITAGGDLYGSACALTSTGGVKCWEPNHGNVPVDVTGLASGVAAIAAGSGLEGGCALTSTGGVKCWGNNGTRPTATDVLPPSSGATAIAAGSEDRGGCAIASAGGVKCWGWRGQAIDVAGLTSGVTAIVGGGDTCVLTSGGGVRCAGLNMYGELGNGSDKGSVTPSNVVGLTSGVTTIAVGNLSMCALTRGGGVKCWGNNDDGQLGNGSTTDASTPVEVEGLKLGVTAIALGDHYACALTSGGGVKCWGSGYGSTPIDVTGL